MYLLDPLVDPRLSQRDPSLAPSSCAQRRKRSVHRYDTVNKTFQVLPARRDGGMLRSLDPAVLPEHRRQQVDHGHTVRSRIHTFAAGAHSFIEITESPSPYRQMYLNRFDLSIR